MSVVGIGDAIPAAHDHVPDVVFCEYDLLATVPLESWERDVLSVLRDVTDLRLTRRSDEMHLLDVNNIAGFFYLPALTEDDARRCLRRSSERRILAAFIARPTDAKFRVACLTRSHVHHQPSVDAVQLRAGRDALSFARPFTCS